MAVLSLAAVVVATIAGAEPRNIPDLNLKLMPIPAGAFVMGSPTNEAGRNDNEGPQTKVTISRPFWLGQTEVTQDQWRAVMGTDIAEQVRRMLADDTLYSLGFNTPKLASAWMVGRVRDGESLPAQKAQCDSADVSLGVCGEVSTSGDE
jgi:formylglycine-generating enzyme required for sulfatase activity